VQQRLRRRLGHRTLLPTPDLPFPCHKNAGAHGLHTGVSIDIVRSDEMAYYERLSPYQSESLPAVRLWRGIESLPNSEVLYREIMRAARLYITLVGTSVADEMALSCMAFIQKQLADMSVDQLSPLHAHEDSRMVRS
jgi:hypothetical protein